MSREAIIKKALSYLSEDQKIVYQQAINGNANAQYNIGLYLFSIADADIMALGIGALAMAAKQGHPGAIKHWASEGKDWRDYM